MQTGIEDKLAIQSVIDSIDVAVDAKDWTKARSFFADEVTVDFGSLGTGRALTMPSNQLIAAWQTNLYTDKKSFHLRGNHIIEINGATASAVSKGYAINAIDKGPVTGIWEVWGNYTYTLTKLHHNWKVTGMYLVVVKTRGDDKVRTYLPG